MNNEGRRDSGVHVEAHRLIMDCMLSICMNYRVSKKNYISRNYDIGLKKNEIFMNVAVVRELLGNVSRVNWSRSIEDRLHNIVFGYIQISDYYLYVKEDPIKAKKALLACFQFSVIQNAGKNQDILKFTKVLETRIRSQQNTIEDYLFIELNNGNKIEPPETIQKNMEYIFRNYLLSNDKMGRIEKLWILLQLIRNHILTTKNLMKLDQFYPLFKQVLESDYSVDQTDLLNKESLIKIFMTFKSSQLAKYEKECVYASIIISKFIHCMIFDPRDPKYLNTKGGISLNNIHRAIVSCVRFLKKFNDTSVLMEKLLNLMEELSSLLEISKNKNIDLDKSDFINTIEKRDMVFDATKNTKQGEDFRNSYFLNAEFKYYQKNIKQSVVHQMIEENKPELKLSFWKVSNPVKEPKKRVNQRVRSRPDMRIETFAANQLQSMAYLNSNIRASRYDTGRFKINTTTVDNTNLRLSLREKKTQSNPKIVRRGAGGRIVITDTTGTARTAANTTLTVRNRSARLLHEDSQGEERSERRRSGKLDREFMGTKIGVFLIDNLELRPFKIPEKKEDDFIIQPGNNEAINIITPRGGNTGRLSQDYNMTNEKEVTSLMKVEFNILAKKNSIARSNPNNKRDLSAISKQEVTDNPQIKKVSLFEKLRPKIKEITRLKALEREENQTNLELNQRNGSLATSEADLSQLVSPDKQKSGEYNKLRIKKKKTTPDLDRSRSKDIYVSEFRRSNNQDQGKRKSKLKK